MTLNADLVGLPRKEEWMKVLLNLSGSLYRLLNCSLARATLARLHAHGDINDPFVLSQMEDIQANLDKSKDIGESRWDWYSRMLDVRFLKLRIIII